MSSQQPSRTAIIAGRGTGYFLLWLLLMPSAKTGDLLFGVVAAGAATWLSLTLYQPLHGRLHPGAFLALVPHFIWQSIVAGIDVARRTFASELRLNPGFVPCPLDFPEGLARNTFATFTSLMPGTVPCGEENGVLVYHCLDVGQPVLEALWAEERLFARAITAGRKHG
ncbi:MAG: Na+/H+ antiporter subunit E [Sandaracinobacter sp.]